MINNKHRSSFICLVALSSGPHGLEHPCHPRMCSVFCSSARRSGLYTGSPGNQSVPSPGTSRNGMDGSGQQGTVERGGCSNMQPWGRFSRRSQPGPQWVTSCEPVISKPASSGPAAPSTVLTGRQGEDGTAACGIPGDGRMRRGSTRVTALVKLILRGN